MILNENQINVLVINLGQKTADTIVKALALLEKQEKENE